MDGAESLNADNFSKKLMKREEIFAGSWAGRGQNEVGMGLKSKLGTGEC